MPDGVFYQEGEIYNGFRRTLPAMFRNEFVEYLNTMNNSDANSKGALAEAQVQSPYFRHINVRRRIGDQLLEYTRDPYPTTVFLTGHAGDGKTSLLAQLLYDLGCLKQGDRLREYDWGKSAWGKPIFYVKDMSELSKDHQDKLCQQALQAAADNGAFAIVVTNTGPLINTLKRLAGDAGAGIESEILARLDRGDGEAFTLRGSRVRFVNIARLPNFRLAAMVLERLVDAELWRPCEECNARSQCSILFNVGIVRKHLNRVAKVLDAHYRYLEEYDRRMTARQITAHLSYALTGGRRCEDVPRLGEAQLLDYHFANLFFGYCGIKPDPTADQIRSIQELRSMGLDQKCVKINPRSDEVETVHQPDFRMFVSPSSCPDLSDLEQETREIVSKGFRGVTAAGGTGTARYRQFYWAVRRFHILFSLSNQELPEMLNSLYSPVYSLYQKATSSSLTTEIKRAIERLVFDALYNLYVGMPPPTGSNTLYLTVRRSHTITQYVQLIEGSIKRSRLEIAQEPASSDAFGDTHRTYKLVLRVPPGNGQTFRLTLPILDYFWRLSRGEVSTTLSPTLSHGVDRLRNLLKTASEANSHSVDEVQLLVLTTGGPKVVTLRLEGDEGFDVY